MKSLVLLPLFLALLCAAQTQSPAPSVASKEDISGMYTFLKEGEFVQIDVDGTRVTGFVSRYGDRDSDKGAFLDHLFKTGELKGDSRSTLSPGRCMASGSNSRGLSCMAPSPTQTKKAIA